MMVSMRYAHNLTRGAGLVWNPGQRVEGFTDLLWTLFMSGVHLLPVSISQTALIVMFANIGLACMMVPLLIRLIGELGGRPLAALTTVSGYVLNRDAMIWTVGGYETTLLTLLVVFAVYRILREARLGKTHLLTYVAIGAISLVRADGVVLSLVLLVFSSLIHREKRQVITCAALSLGFVAASELFRIWYYGDVLPNTAYLKTMNWDGHLFAGMLYAWDFLKPHAIILGFAALAFVLQTDRLRRLLLALLFLYFAYVVYVGGDAHGYFRFFSPGIPLLFALAFVGIEKLGVPPGIRIAACVLCFVTLPLTNPGFIRSMMAENRNGNVDIGLLIAKNTSPDSRIADSMAGSVFYYSDRYGIDLLGKTDPYIARLAAVPGATVPGHNKWDLAYSLNRLKPDIVVAPVKYPVQEEALHQPPLGNWKFISDLYDDPTFHAHCLPNPLSVDTFRTIFVCDWSPEMAAKNNWQSLAVSP